MPQPPLFDAHVHSRFSADGRDAVLDLCQAALERGLAGLTITDHFDTDPLDHGYGRYDPDAICRDVEQARRVFGERLSVLVGAEVCYQPPFARQIADFLQACPLDFALGGVHYVRREYVEAAYFTRRAVEEAYEAYFQAVGQAVQSGLFDSLAHLDLAKRYAPPASGPFDPRRYWEQIERILRLMIEQGIALEINTKALRQGCTAPFPDEAILRRYAELGGTRITIGSDCHKAADLGYRVAWAHDLARSAGFTHVTRFVQRRPRLYPL